MQRKFFLYVSVTRQNDIDLDKDAPEGKKVIWKNISPATYSQQISGKNREYK